VDGWLRAMVARELGMRRPEVLDEDARELVLDGRRTASTELEFSLLRVLIENEGKAVRRSELLERVWGRTYTSGSNVVDVVVRCCGRRWGRARCWWRRCGAWGIGSGVSQGRRECATREWWYGVRYGDYEDHDNS
jgi:hypothetical protein